VKLVDLQARNMGKSHNVYEEREIVLNLKRGRRLTVKYARKWRNITKNGPQNGEKDIN